MFKYGLFGKGYDSEGFNKSGYDRDGYDRNGFNTEGYDRSGYGRSGFNAEGYDRSGYDKYGFDKNGYNRHGFDKSGFDRSGYNKDGYDKYGFNAEGYDRSGYDRNGFDIYGYNRSGYDKAGFDKFGYDKKGYNRSGFNLSGYDRDGYDKDGYNESGYDRSGFDRNGYNKAGYNQRGFNSLGYDRAGYDRDGYNKEGYSRSGFNREGYDKTGYNKKGYDKDGYNKLGFNEKGYDRNGQTASFFDDAYKSANSVNEYQRVDAIRIGLASPEKIREWSHGEVKNPETLNYRTLKPEKDGLFCEKIFGPQKDWECNCGKYKRVRYKGVVCDRCGVEVTRAKVRRERMGHIELAVPVSHIWYFKGIPSQMGLILDMSPYLLEKVLYFAAYVVIDPGKTGLMKSQILSEREYREECEKYGSEAFRAGMGAEAILEMLQAIDLEALYEELKADLDCARGQKKIRTVRRLEVVESFRQSGNKPEWMIMTVIPVIPPEIRPMISLSGGRFATSDLNDLYRRVINRNNRLKRLIDLGAPEIIVRNEKRRLQEEVDALIDNGRRGRPVTGPGNRPLKSLSDMLKGKQGRFRQNLLGKRVDYSGRSVIVVGPELKLYQCGLPKKIALELFKPFVTKELVNDGLAHSIKSAKRMVERVRPEVWDVLECVISEHPVLLSHIPTVHRLGLQAFEPVLVEGRAIKLHPIVCTAFNANFDGDQMAVYLPLSAEAQAEARFLMLSAHNLINPQNGDIITIPDQEMVLGCYYLTACVDDELGVGKVFSSENEVIMAYENGAVGLHAPIKVRITREINGEKVTGIIDATVGRLIFNEKIPQDLGFVDRSKPENKLALEVAFRVDQKKIVEIIERCMKVYGVTETAVLLDEIKAMGFKFSTKSGISIGLSDMKIPKEKKICIAEAEREVEEIKKKSLFTNGKRRERATWLWEGTTKKIANAVMQNFDDSNSVYMMVNSGAKGSVNQMGQLVGMRGLVSDVLSKAIDNPIKSNFREGLATFEYFTSAYGTRKRLADSSIEVVDAFYLTRRLVDVAQAVVVREEDCGTTEGIVVGDIKDGNEIIENLKERIIGRILCEDVIHPETGEIVCDKDEIISTDKASEIVATGIKNIKIRSVLKCQSNRGVCAKCYGQNLATGDKVNIGEAVGVIAAQSLGKSFIQYTKNSFETDNMDGIKDITNSLFRVEELFEARKPRNVAIVTEIGGRVKISENKKKREITILDDENGNSATYPIPYGSRIKVRDEQVIEAGDELTEGSVNPHDILAIKGYTAVQDYLIQEVQRVYRLQGVDINDKHIEVIVRQIMNKVKVEDAGDTDFLTGSLVERYELERVNNRMREEGKAEAVHAEVLMGITKVNLTTDSFLSAASFQETTRVLTDAAIKGKIDPLVGLKENVIIGNIIPAGTGIQQYSDIEVVPAKPPEDMLFD